MFPNDLIDFVRHGQHIKPRTSDCVNIGQNSKLLKISMNNDYCIEQSALFLVLLMCGYRGGGGGQGVRTPPLENYKNIGFLSNTGPVPLKITKLPSQHSNFLDPSMLFHTNLTNQMTA